MLERGFTPPQVLLEFDGLRRDITPSRSEGSDVASTLSACSFTGGAGGKPEGAAGGHFQVTCSGKEVFGTLMANCGTKQWLGNQEALSGDFHVFAPTIVMAHGQVGAEITEDFAPTLTCTHEQPIKVVQNMRVRRLMPVECERLQGFPDGYTDIGTLDKPSADTHRYKALGNSMAVLVMNWIGRRIEFAIRKPWR